jgi:hypothetical protein
MLACPLPTAVPMVHGHAKRVQPFAEFAEFASSGPPNVVGKSQSITSPGWMARDRLRTAADIPELHPFWNQLRQQRGRDGGASLLLSSCRDRCGGGGGAAPRWQQRCRRSALWQGVDVGNRKWVRIGSGCSRR